MEKSDKVHTRRRNRRRKCSNFTAPQPTCYTRKQLIEFALDWNESNPQHSIMNLKQLKKGELWRELRKRHKTDQEDQWINKTRKVNKRRANESFAPIVPWSKENKNAWLSDDDIHNVMRRCEHNFEGFHFLEPAPIDFDTKTAFGTCAYSGLCNYSYDELASKYKTFGAIFNTDTHDGPGQHWISLFVNLEKGMICYFDSVGDKPPAEIGTLIERFRNQGNAYFRKIKKQVKVHVHINKTRHQLGNTECGVYCIYFIYAMLLNGDFKAFERQRIPDLSMTKCRGFFFDDLNNIYT